MVKSFQHYFWSSQLHSINASQLQSKYFQACNIYHRRNPLMFYIGSTCVSAEPWAEDGNQPENTLQNQGLIWARNKNLSRIWANKACQDCSRDGFFSRIEATGRSEHFYERYLFFHIFQIKVCIRDKAPWFHQEDSHILSCNRTQFIDTREFRGF